MEVIIDGIRYVPLEKQKNKEVGDVVKFSSLEWFIIDQDEDTYTLFLKECMSPELVQKHFTQHGMVDNDYDIRYSFNSNNDWKESYIRLVLNT